MAELRDAVAAGMKLTKDVLELRLPSGRQRVFSNRIAWACVYLAKARAVERVRRGVLRAALANEVLDAVKRSSATFYSLKDWLWMSRLPWDTAGRLRRRGGLWGARAKKGVFLPDVKVLKGRDRICAEDRETDCFDRRGTVGWVDELG